MPIWDTILNTIGAEFSDLSDIEMGTRITLRLLLAALLGGMLGYERASQGKAAGVRTHMLVALGAALFVVVPEQAGVAEDAMSRVTQGVIAGVGFLCAGTILKSERDTDVRGLTTAAGIWLTAAIGVAVGVGYEITAIISALMVLFVLNVIPSSSDKKSTQE
ncbi:MAG: MgtC/SapB family protein [Gammaproteobacteria bacterium]|nr:MgtC/SapB family protein [Gammaproteobacteria bacterium]MDP2139516.1 MgtC/SapB family protein [Gammaproteobacteria bacterium]MDP2348471.1 MgtC/SapB family protein [Gammaproteobacteria bacterium]